MQTSKLPPAAASATPSPTLLVQLDAHPDFSQVEQMPRGAARKQAAWDELLLTAEGAQREVRAVADRLVELGAVRGYEVLVSPNALLVTPAPGIDGAVADVLADLPGVASVLADRPVPVRAGAPAAPGAGTTPAAAGAAEPVVGSILGFGTDTLVAPGVRVASGRPQPAAAAGYAELLRALQWMQAPVPNGGGDPQPPLAPDVVRLPATSPTEHDASVTRAIAALHAAGIDTVVAPDGSTSGQAS